MKLVSIWSNNSTEILPLRKRLPEISGAARPNDGALDRRAYGLFNPDNLEVTPMPTSLAGHLAPEPNLLPRAEKASPRAGRRRWIAGRSRTSAALAWLGIVALAGSLVGTDSYAASHGRLQYDPSQCAKDPQGMVYFALGRLVFRQPAKNLAYISGGLEEDPSLPQPPDPSQPMGCPDHPIRGAASYSLQRFSAMPGEKPNPASEYADHISLVINDGSRGVATEDGLFDLLSSRYKSTEDTVPGFIRSGPKPITGGAFGYRATSYLIPDGRLLTIACRDNALAPPPDISITCRYAYSIGADLGVYAAFVTKAVPLTEIIAADQELRRRIEAAKVRDFPWTDAKTKTTGTTQ